MEALCMTGGGDDDRLAARVSATTTLLAIMRENVGRRMTSGALTRELVKRENISARDARAVLNNVTDLIRAGKLPLEEPQGPTIDQQVARWKREVAGIVRSGKS
jgi:hypothetical protein